MNKTQNKFNFKAFLTILTAFALSLVFCFATACGGGQSSSSSESESETTSESESVKDTQTIANGNFEFNVPDSASYPYYSSSNIKWTRTTYGTTKSSGVIDVEKVDASKDEYKNIRREGAEGTKMLMLANDTNSDGDGAIQYYTSSTTITAEYGKDYLLTVWVRTNELSNKYSNDDVKTGAYIEIKNTVGEAIDSIVIDNIDTEGEWKQYSIYLRPGNYATTKYQFVLGLGHGNSDNKLRGCSGYAYFDDVQLETLEKGEDGKTSFDTVENAEEFKLYDAENNKVSGDAPFTADTQKVGATNVFKADFSKAVQDVNVLNGSGAYNNFNLNNRDNNDAEVFGTPVVSENGELKIDFTKAGREYGSSYTYTTGSFNLDKFADVEDQTTEFKGVMISFIANVKANSYSTNASVKVLDGADDNENGGFDSFATDGKDVRYAIYLTTNRESMNYKLKISFGPTSETSTNTDFPVGTAIFKDFKVVYLTEEEFDVADTSNNGTKVTLLGDYNSDVSDDTDKTEDSDTYDITTNAVMADPDGNALSVGLDRIVGGAYTASFDTNAENNALLVNSKYTYAKADVTSALADLKATYTANNPNGNKNVQAIALFVKNGGYIYMKDTTVAANSVYKFSVKIRVTSGTAFVRLFDYDLSDLDSAGDIAKFTEGDTSYAMSTTITKDSKKDLDGYTTVTFVIRTGDKAKNFALQFGFEGEGFALIGNADKGSTYSGASDYDTLVKAFDSKYYEIENVAEHTKTVKYYKTEEDAKDGKNAITEKDSSGNKVEKVTETTDVVVAKGYLKNETGDGKTNVLQFYRYDTKETTLYVVENESDEDSSEEESSSDTTNVGSTASYAWLQIVSIIIAVVLVAALIAVIIRMATKNRTSKKAKKEAYYKGYDKNKRYLATNKSADKNNVQAPEETNEAYDYGDNENKDTNNDNE